MGGISMATEMIPGVAALAVPSPAARRQPVDPAPAESLPEKAPAVEQPERRPLVVEQENLQAHYTFDQQLRQVVITLTRPDSGEVVRQIPAEQVQRFLHSFLELAGKYFDGRA